MRRLLLRDVEEWTLGDFQEVVEGRIPEGQRVDYKRTLQLDRERAKAEVAKDVSGFANAQGGLILFGVDEDDSPEPLPSAVVPFPSMGLQTRLENILDSTLHPIPEYQVATIDTEAGSLIVARVAAHPGPPVMVQGYGENRYFTRSGTRTRPMNATEVAAAHAKAEGRERRLEAHLRQLPLVARIFRDRVVDEMQLGRAVDWTPMVTVVMAAIDGPEELVAPNLIARHAFEERLEGYRGGGGMVRPGLHWDITAHGLVAELVDPDDPQHILHRYAIHRLGVVEWAYRYRRDPYEIPSTSLADDVHNALLYGARVFDSLGYGGRLATWVRIENAERAKLMFARDWDEDTRLPDVQCLSAYREVSVDELLVDRTATVREAMDRIWQGFGIQRCGLFEADGDWLQS